MLFSHIVATSLLVFHFVLLLQICVLFSVPRFGLSDRHLHNHIFGKQKSIKEDMARKKIQTGVYWKEESVSSLTKRIPWLSWYHGWCIVQHRDLTKTWNKVWFDNIKNMKDLSSSVLSIWHYSETPPTSIKIHFVDNDMTWLRLPGVSLSRKIVFSWWRCTIFGTSLVHLNVVLV